MCLFGRMHAMAWFRVHGTPCVSWISPATMWMDSEDRTKVIRHGSLFTQHLASSLSKLEESENSAFSQAGWKRQAFDSKTSLQDMIRQTETKALAWTAMSTYIYAQVYALYTHTHTHTHAKKEQISHLGSCPMSNIPFCYEHSDRICSLYESSTLALTGRGRHGYCLTSCQYLYFNSPLDELKGISRTRHTSTSLLSHLSGNPYIHSPESLWLSKHRRRSLHKSPEVAGWCPV